MNFRIAGTTFAALVLFPLATIAAPTPPKPAVDTRPVSEADRKSFREATASNPLLVLIMENFPDEYGSFETQLLRDADAGTVNIQEAAERANGFVTSIQMRLLPYIAQASAPELKTLMEHHLSATRVLQKYNLQACQEFGGGRGATMAMYLSLPDEALRALQSYGAQEMKTGISGQKQKLSHALLADDALDPALIRYEELGGDLNFLASIAEDDGNYTPSARCQNTILWLQALSEQKAEVIASVLSAPDE